MTQKQILEIIHRGTETRDLDYKGAMEWDESDKKACASLVKDVLAMANSGGGYLVIGVDEKDHGFEWTGLDADALESFESSRFNRFIQNYSDPPVNCTIAKVPDDGKNFVVIGVPSFHDTPHICQKGFPGALRATALYVRTANNESAEVKSSSDVRSLIEKAVRNQQDYLLTSFRGILTGTAQESQSAETEQAVDNLITEAITKFEALNPYKSLQYKGYYDLWSFPSNLVKDRASLELLRPVATGASEDYGQGAFLWISNDSKMTYHISEGIETIISLKDFRGNDYADFWQLQRSLFFFHRSLMWEESYSRRANSRPVADIREIMTYVAGGIKCVTKMYESYVQPDEVVKIGFRMTATQERRLLNVDPDWPTLGDYTAPDFIHNFL